MEPKLYESVYKPRAGGATTKAVTRTIVGTDLSQTEVLLREAVQNSYDAKLDNTNPLEFNLNCYKLEESNCENIKAAFTKAGPLGKEIADKLSTNFYNLEITDRNTTGLIGYSGFQEKNINRELEEKFHHFVYMTGNDEIKNQESGGSFGFGKIALYRYSKIGTIVIYSRVYNQENKKYESRFIISKINSSESEAKSRCWWGVEGKYEDNSSYARPILDNEADDFAALFGMQKFTKAETGTNILVLNPIETHEDADILKTFQEEIPCLLTHWFWPKMVSLNTTKKIIFKLSLDNYDITENIPNPKSTYPYSSFYRAFRNCVDYYSHKAGASNDDMKVVTFERPRVELGAIFLKKEGIKDFLYSDYIKLKWDKPYVALMRDVEFIVKYKPVDIDISNTNVGCFGIFHTNHLGQQRTSTDKYEVEHYFRDIENQTHDKWVHTDIHKYNYLRKVESDIDEYVKQYLDFTVSIGNKASISGLVAQKLGSKLGFGFKGGASRKVPEKFPGNSTGKKAASFTRTKDPIELKIINGQKFIILKYEAKLLEEKKISIKLVPTIQSFDPHDKEIAEPEELLITHLEMPTKGCILKLIPLPDKSLYTFLIQKSGIYDVYVQTNIQCAFEIAVSKEELND